MSRRIVALMALLLSFGALAPAATPVRAGAQRWSAWMYDHTNGQMLLLTDTLGGTPQSLTLPMPAGYNTYGRTVAISHDWHYMAYTVQNSGTSAHAIVVYDRNAGTVFYSLPVAGPDSISLDFRSDELVFNETSTSLAFAYTIDNMMGWEIKVIQLGVGAGIPTLRHDQPPVAAVGIRKEYTLPVIRRHRGTEVTFNTVAMATEGSPHYDTYTWNISTGQVRRDISYPSLGTDTYVPTGETISTMNDPRLPSCGEPCGPFFNGNVLSVYDPHVAGIFPVYATPDSNLSAAQFIQNGERVLFAKYRTSEGNEAVWSVLERSGAVVATLSPAVKIGSMTGWQDGFLYIPPLINGTEAPRLIVVNSRENVDANSVVWTGPPGAEIALLQTPSNMQGTGPFAPWKPLAAPSSSAAAPGSSSGGEIGALQVGGKAMVNTTQGDKLRMRSGPGTSFSVVMLLDNGTVVTLLEGPRSGNGLTWWRVRAPNGAEGWVIESIDDNGEHIQTLIPQ